MPGKSLVAVANEEVSIVTVLQMLAIELPDDIGTGRSRKLHCPFEQLYHSDHGASPALRVYPDTNSAYCFSCAAYFTPVSLAAKAMDCDRQTAATRLLDRIGHRPLDLVAAFQAAADYEPEPDKALLADALKTFCRRTAERWGETQFEPRVATTLTRCLALLDLVRSEDDVRAWLGTCKTAMTRVLEEDQPSLSQKVALLWEDQVQRGGRRT